MQVSRKQMLKDGRQEPNLCSPRWGGRRDIFGGEIKIPHTYKMGKDATKKWVKKSRECQ